MRHSCDVSSGTDAISPYRPTRRFASFPLMVVEMKRSLPHTTGLESPRPGIAVFQATFAPVDAFHVAGMEKPSPIPLAAMPRNCGQSTPGRAPVAARGSVIAATISRTIDTQVRRMGTSRGKMREILHRGARTAARFVTAYCSGTPPAGAALSLPTAPSAVLACQTVPVVLIRKWRWPGVTEIGGAHAGNRGATRVDHLHAVPATPVPVIERAKPLLIALGACARSGLRNADPPDGPLPRMSSDCAYLPLAQLAAKVPCALLIARSEPIAQASLPEMRARTRPGIAIAAMMPMIATTISSSMSVKPLSVRTCITVSILVMKRIPGVTAT